MTPTVAVTIDHSDVNLAANTALVTFSFSEAPTDFTAANITTKGGTLGTLTEVNATTYTATFTAASGTDISNAAVSVDNNWHEDNGNPGTAASTSFTVDTVTPTVAVATSNTDVTVAHNTATITFSFSEAPTSFTLADTTATGGTLGTLTEVNATTYTATFTGAANTDINNASVGVIAGSWQENNGNPGAAGTTGSFTVDTGEGPEPPTLRLGATTATVSEGGTVRLPAITVTKVDSDDTLTVTIAGLPTGASITDSADRTVFHGGSTITLTGNEVGSTLTLHDGTNDESFQLTVTANNTTKGEQGSSASQQIAVTLLAPPAGVAGSPINLALTKSSRVGALTTVTISGMPADWSLNEGKNLGNGTWTVETNDLSALTVLTAAAYAGAMVLGVTETWANADGSTGTAFVADNVEAYAPGFADLRLVGQRHADRRRRQRPLRLRAADRQRHDLQFQRRDRQDRPDGLRRHCQLRRPCGPYCRGRQRRRGDHARRRRDDHAARRRCGVAHRGRLRVQSDARSSTTPAPWR